MTTAVIGATGRVGSQIVRGVLPRGDAVTALVRDPGKARRTFGEPGGLAGPGHRPFVALRSVPKCLNDAAAARFRCSGRRRPCAPDRLALGDLASSDCRQGPWRR
jgi:nucleoside-diphosphate-sugar epimerase